MTTVFFDDWLANRARATPGATAVIIGNEQWDYGQLNKLATLAARNLVGYTKTGDRVAALMANNLSYVCLIHALARIGAVLVPLNTRLTVREISWQIKRARCTVLISDHTTADKSAEVDIRNLQKIPDTVLFQPDPGNQEKEEGVVAINPKKDQAILFTSGTTGKPKGARLTFSNHFYSAVASGWRLGVLPDDCWLCCLPLYHVGGMAILLRSCLYGTAVELHDGFNAAAVSESLDSGRITLISLVPTMLHRLLSYREGRRWPAALRHVLLGGAAAPPALIEASRQLEIPISATYGLTEAASQVCTSLHEDFYRKPGSVGRPLLFTQVGIFSKDGQELPALEPGEIVVSGPTVMAGYDQNDETGAGILQDGRLHTGDIGYMDKDGDLWVLQREGDIIISGGENVYPTEVEAVLTSHPAVVAACVIGIQDEEWGQRVAAAVVPTESGAISAEELLTYCRQDLAGYKLPRVVVFVNALPQTASGKIQRQSVLQIIERSDPSSHAAIENM